MLVGVDVSEFQGSIDWQTLKNNTNFVIIRSSYGNGYIDKWFGNNRQQARNLGLLRGFYHYAYPEYNTPEAEADWFCKVLNGDPLQEGEVLFLDMEEQFSGDKLDWSKRFLDYVSAKLGCKPLFYSYQDYMNGVNWQPLVDSGYGLWLASYTYDPNNNTGNVQQWPFMAFQQWTDVEAVPGISGNVDGDAFFGTPDQFKAYGFKAVSSTQVPVTTSDGTTSVEVSTEPVVTTSTNPTPSATQSATTENPPIVVKPLPKTQPTKPPMTIGSRIVWALLNIFRILWGEKK